MKNTLRFIGIGAAVAILGFSGAFAHGGSHTGSHTSSHTGSHASSHTSPHSHRPSSSTSHSPKTAHVPKQVNSHSTHVAAHHLAAPSRPPHGTSLTSPSHTGSRATASSAPRHAHGRFKRSTRAKDAFKRSHPCPTTGRTTGACPGYVVDHIRALKHGGADSASNMQWQSVAAAKAKDKVE